MDYGPVLITDGKYKGRIGYFDDDDSDGAIVYFGAFLSKGKKRPYEIVPYEFLTELTSDNISKYCLNMMYPEPD